MPTAVRKTTKEPTKAHCQQPNLFWRSNDRFGFNNTKYKVYVGNGIAAKAVPFFVTFSRCGWRVSCGACCRARQASIIGGIPSVVKLKTVFMFAYMCIFC